MKKERLTKERIKIDLRHRIKAARIRLVVFFVLAILALVPFVLTITKLPLWHPSVVPLLIRSSLLLFLPLLCLALQSIDLVRYHRIVTSPDYITTGAHSILFAPSIVLFVGRAIGAVARKMKAIVLVDSQKSRIRIFNLFSAN